MTQTTNEALTCQYHPGGPRMPVCGIPAEAIVSFAFPAVHAEPGSAALAACGKHAEIIASQLAKSSVSSFEVTLLKEKGA